MARWDATLFALLAAQPVETTSVTITLEELAAFAGGPIADAAYGRSYWSGHGPGTLGRRIRLAGWRVAEMHEGIHATITFVRQPSDTSG